MAAHPPDHGSCWMLNVGVDMHQAVAVARVPDKHGKEIKTRTIRGGWQSMPAWVAGLRERSQVCFDASIG